MAFLPAAIAVLAVVWGWTRSDLPALDGRTPVVGLGAHVEVRFDAFAIPHIYAATTGDAWQAVGFLQARDRLWQMELYRRAASGRLSELLGEPTVVIDERFLTLGLRHAAEVEWSGAAPEVREALQKYSAGVNDYIAAAGRWKLPLELQLLRVRPEPWTPVDSLAIGKLFAWRLGENHNGELLRYTLVEELGPRAMELLGGASEWGPQILAHTFPDEERAKGVRLRAKDHAYPAGLDWLSDERHGASNSWVLSGSRTASGRPLLANDPHLALEMPSVWWEAHIITGPPDGRQRMNVAGITIPGIPFVIIGHNDRIAWGLTNSGADVQDFFVERLDPSRTRYLSGTAWLPLETARHDIRVSGRHDPIVFEVRQTRHGPVLNAADWREIVAGDPPQPAQLHETVLALKWDAVGSGESAGAFEAFTYASNWPEFLAAVRRFSAPSQNFVYADVDGNIGYAMSGLLPIRSSGEGTLPSIGWTGDAEWKGSVESAALPALFNPASGQIVTANNEVSRQLPYLITRDWVAPFRARRIGELLGDRRGLDIRALEQMQADITSLSADSILKAAGEAAPQELRNWDRRVDARPVAAFYEAFEQALWRRTFADDMSPALYDRFYRYAANERFAGLHAIITDRTSPWFDDRATPEVRETRDDIVRLAAQDAVGSLEAQFGPENSWQWDRIHAMTFSHVLGGGGRLLDWFFSRGPIRLAGDGMTINKTSTNLRHPYETSEAASYRQILDVGDWDQSVAVNTTGQSGHAASPHYFDQNPLWREGRYHGLPFSRSAVEAETASRLELVPGK